MRSDSDPHVDLPAQDLAVSLVFAPTG